MPPQREKPKISRIERESFRPTSSEPESFEGITSVVDTLAPDSTTWHEKPEDTLTAPVRMPSREAMTVHLGPLNLIERVEEYQADENQAHTLLGLFVGAILGIIANWATSTPFQISSFSIVLIVLLIILTISVYIWLRRIRRKKDSVKSKLRAP